MSNDKDTSAKSGGFFSRLKQRFSGSSDAAAPEAAKPSRLTLGLSSLGWLSGKKLDDDLAEELEDQLLLADVGVATTQSIIDQLHSRVKKSPSVAEALRDVLRDIIAPRVAPLELSANTKPYVILMVGVNGSGKTTTIGKLAKHFKSQGLSVMLAAGDTFRAAAVEQLQTWGERNDVPVIAQGTGADPAAVIFDAVESARNKGVDVLLADTAGRLQTQDGLMRELQKIVRVAGKTDPLAPHEKMLVLDASLGQNAIAQAVQFHEAIGLTGITMTKLDGGAKGGTLVALANTLDVPFRFIGTGEQADNLEPFDTEDFIDTLLSGAPIDTPNTTDTE